MYYGMDENRWNDLVFGSADRLTPEEVEAGWHWCGSWDDMLIHPDSPEAELCMCPFKQGMELQIDE